MAAAHTKITELDRDKVALLRQWAQQSDMPASELEILEALVAQYERLDEVLRSNARLLKLLQQAFSGKGKSESLGRPENRKNKPDKANPDKAPGVQEGKVTKRTAREHAPSAQPPKAQAHAAPLESLFAGDTASAVTPLGTDLGADGLRIAKEDELGKLKEEWNEREVVDVKIVVSRTVHRVQTLTNTRTGQQVTGVLPNVPPGSKYTYETYFLVAMMHVQMCMPYTRLAVALGIPKTVCYDMVRFVAATLLPVYLQLWRELCTRRYLMVDDTTTKILEKTPVDRQADDGSDEVGGSSVEYKALAPTESLMAAISTGLGLPKLGTTAEGKKASVTVVHGFESARDLDTRIVFYLSHCGQAGDVLEILLAHRTGDPPVSLVSDMLAANFPTPETRQRVKLTSVGCSAHARRRFFACTDHDDEMWYFIRGFAILADVESYAGENSHKPGEVVRIRQAYAGRVWRLMKARAEAFMFKSGWEPSSAPYKSCAYLVKHFTALTRHLADEHLPTTNNLCERALRREKIMLGSSRFRETFEGHAALDIITSILATLTRVGAGEAGPRAYLVDAMKNRDAVALNPEAWTPAAWLKRQRAAGTGA